MNKSSKKPRSILLILVALLVVFSSIGAAGPKTTIDVKILAVNDFHGALETAATSNFGGAAYLATYVKNIRAENPANTVFVSSGDMIGASPLLSALFFDEPTIEAFNLMGLDYNVTGNHEFDKGIDELRRLKDGGCHPVHGCIDGDPYYGAEFQFLSANVIRDNNGKTLFQPYKVRSFAGVKVAFVGIALEGTPRIVTPAGTAGVSFLDEAMVLNDIVAELKEKGIKNIVAIVHAGTNACSNPGGNHLINRTDPEVDVFIMGHGHSTYNCVINNTSVSEAGSAGGTFTEIDLKFDRKTGDLISVSNRNVRVDKRLVDPDPEMTVLLDKYRELSKPLANRVIGSITADITRTNNSAGESALGDVIADAKLFATKAPEKGGAVVAFMNPGGIRANFTYNQISGGELSGEITYAEAFTVQPFGNDVVTMTMSGATILELLESQFQGCVRLQVSEGFNYSYSNSAPAGSKIREVTINGVPLDPDASYRVSTNNFLADGGDGCTVFTKGTDRLVGPVDLEALVDYFAVFSPIAPGPQNRITRLP